MRMFKNSCKVMTAICLLGMFLLANVTFGQSYISQSKIAVVARYKSTGVELRWIPDNKTIMNLALESSFNVERRESGNNKFTKIKEIKALSKKQWEELISSETNPELKSNLELASDFLFADKVASEKEINLDEGIYELNKQKSKEDMVYAVFVFSAIKDAIVAQSLGLGLTDKTVEPGKTYDYRISLNAKSPIYEIQNGEITIKTIENPDAYKNEVFVYPGDTKLSFAWSAQPDVSGYFIERASEGDGTFKQLNSTPIYTAKGDGFIGKTNGAYEDDSLINYKLYRYRFYGKTSFGEKVLFAEVEGMPRDLTPPSSPIMMQLKNNSAKEVKIDWDFNDNAGDLHGFMVARSDKDTGSYTILHKELLPPNARTFKDSTFTTDSLNYYIVYALDTAGNISSSLPGYAALVDSTPPAKPTIKSAIIDSLGIVTITLELNKEKDLKGYRLYKANGEDHEFSVFTESFREDKDDTLNIVYVFKDTITLHSLTPKIYYRVKALDFNYNQSEFSDIIAVVRPDTIPPVEPVISNVAVNDKQIILEFALSSSADVIQNIIYRKTDMSKEWEKLAVCTPEQKTYTDTTVVINQSYYYSMRAVDNSNLYSPYSHPVYGKPYDKGIRPVVTNLAANVIQKNVVLNWDYPQTYAGAIFVIYKKDKKGNLEQYGKTTDKTFTDGNTEKENTYSIKVFTLDGGQSSKSELIFKKFD
jgi:fibronectin type 3 domain-containing protein